MWSSSRRFVASARKPRWAADRLDIRHARDGPVASGRFVASSRCGGADAVLLVRQGGWRGSRGRPSTLRHVTDPVASTGPANRWLAVDLGRGAAYADRQDADKSLLTFRSEPLACCSPHCGLSTKLLHLATSGFDGAVYVYLEEVAPDGEVTDAT